MGRDLFRKGGPYNIKKTGAEEYTMSVTLPKDLDGLIARECPNNQCSPAYFKVKPGTGITTGQEFVFCPYCKFRCEQSDITTKEQLRYSKNIALREAHHAVKGMIKDAFKLGPSGKKKLRGNFLSIELSYKPGPKPFVHRPFEEDIRRDLQCPHCRLDHSVYGIATWCPDCGEDIFLTHVETELAVIKTVITDIDRRREILGVRIPSKDLENCLEDTVSIFEAVLRTLTRRYMFAQNTSTSEIDQFFQKNIRNRFQNVSEGQDILLNKFHISLTDILSEKELGKLDTIFAKRHPITHNLGVVDKQYLQRCKSAEKEGREILVNKEEIETGISLSIKVYRGIHT